MRGVEQIPSYDGGMHIGFHYMKERGGADSITWRKGSGKDYIIWRRETERIPSLTEGGGADYIICQKGAERILSYDRWWQSGWHHMAKGVDLIPSYDRNVCPLASVGRRDVLEHRLRVPYTMTFFPPKFSTCMVEVTPPNCTLSKLPPLLVPRSFEFLPPLARIVTA